MKDKFKRIIFVIFFIAWTCIWFRNFYKDFSEHLEETKQLCGKPLQKKWEYVFGADLYKYLSASKRLIPENEKIIFIRSLDWYRDWRARYFLYPRIQSSDADFIMIYKHPYTKSKDARVIYTQGSDTLIIKK